MREQHRQPASRADRKTDRAGIESLDFLPRAPERSFRLNGMSGFAESFPRQEKFQIQIMGERIVDRRIPDRGSVGRRTSARPVVAPVILIRTRPEPLADNALNPSDASGQKILFQKLNLPSVDMLKPDGDEFSGLFFRFHHAPDCGAGPCGRLFHQHIRAVFQRLNGQRFMERNSGRNADQIQLPAQFRKHRVGGRVNPCAAFPELSDLRRRLFRIDDDRR